MTKLLEDILLEPETLERCLHGLLANSTAEIEAAARIVGKTRRADVVGIGSSWNASFAVCAALERAGVHSQPWDASELLHFGGDHSGATAIVLSRSGRSVEIVRLLSRFRDQGCRVIAVTNTPDSPLAESADITIQLNARFDHMVSVSMYTTLVLGGCLVGSAMRGRLSEDADRMADALRNTGHRIAGWREQLEGSDWLAPESPTCFLARGGSMASAQESRLLWEEASKAQATALTTGGFRHGSQETIRPGMRVGMWIDAQVLREPDLQLATDLRAAGVRVMAIGQDVPPDSADLVFNIPSIPAAWQPLIDIIPAQLAAERLAGLRGQDCDSFRYCTYVIESEGGLETRAREATR